MDSFRAVTNQVTDFLIAAPHEQYRTWLRLVLLHSSLLVEGLVGAPGERLQANQEVVFKLRSAASSDHKVSKRPRDIDLSQL